LDLKNQGKKSAKTRKNGFLRNDCAYGGGESRKPTKNQGEIQGSRKPSVLVGFLRQKKDCAYILRADTKVVGRPFQQLTSATFLLSTSTQLPLLKYPLLFAFQLKELTIGQMYHPLEDSFIAAFLTWNPMAHLERFQLTKGMSGGIENKHVTSF
jgi:hypothetical protein